MTENPYNKPITDLTVIGCFDILSLRKVSSIKNSLAKYNCEELHIGVIGDRLGFEKQEQYPLQEENQREKNLFFQLQLKPTVILNNEALQLFIEDRKEKSRFIILASENAVLKESISTLLEEMNCIYTFEEAFTSDNGRYDKWLEKRRGLHK